MLAALTFLAVIVFAYLAAHFVLDRLQSRYLFVSGLEYVLLGVLVGPELPDMLAPVVDLGTGARGIIHHEVLRQLAPLVSLAIGWGGLLYGMQFDLRHVVNARDGALSLSFVHFLVTAGAVWLASHALLATGWLGPVPRDSLHLVPMMLAATALVSSPRSVELVTRRFGARGRHTGLLDGSTRLDEILAIFFFGAIFCLFHPQQVDLPRQLAFTEWYVVSLVLGLVMGVVFHVFLGNEEDEDKLFLALVGIVVFASGTAHFLELSPLLVNLVLGMVLANTSRHGNRLLAVIRRTHRPIVLVLLVFAGALWRPVPAAALVLFVVYVAARLAGRFLGGWLGATSVGPELRRDLGRGLVGHGEVAVAMALNLRLVYEGALLDLVFTAVVLSVVLGELFSARFLKGLLIDAGEIEASNLRERTPSGLPPSERESARLAPPAVQRGGYLPGDAESSDGGH